MTRNTRRQLHEISPNPAYELHIPLHDGDSFRVQCTKIGVFKEMDQVPECGRDRSRSILVTWHTNGNDDPIRKNLLTLQWLPAARAELNSAISNPIVPTRRNNLPLSPLPVDQVFAVNS